MTAKLVKNGQDEVVILTGIQTSHHRSTATPQCSPAPGTGALSVKSSETVMVSLFGSRWVLAG